MSLECPSPPGPPACVTESRRDPQVCIYANKITTIIMMMKSASATTEVVKSCTHPCLAFHTFGGNKKSHPLNVESVHQMKKMSAIYKSFIYEYGYIVNSGRFVVNYKLSILLLWGKGFFL